MSSENGKEQQQEKGGAEQPSAQFELKITFSPVTGRVDVNGPLANKMMCYGMLQMAKDIVAAWKPTEALK